MKYRLLFALCCPLLFTGLTAAAQEKTAPLPPPDQGILKTAPLPPPDEDTVKTDPVPDSQTKARAPTPPQPSSGTARGTGTTETGTPRAPAPAQPSSGTPRGTGTTGNAPRASTPAARPVAASSQAGIPGKGVFWGTMLGGSLYRYNNDSYSDNSYGYSEEIDGGAGFNFDFFLGYDFGLLAGQVEFLLTGDKGNLDTYSTYYEFSGTTIQIPIMLKLDLHGSRFMFQPQAGLYFNIEVGKMDYEMEYYQSSYRYVTYEGSVEYDHPLMGVMVGWALGVRIGRGYLFTDFRYATNLGETELDNMGKYHRSAFMFNLGYQYYFKGKQ